ncbi:MAG: glycoside hydrolase family 99-like domain-containing protein [Chloroflexi bacterium]|nr:glycoside hydrolase family 99-like domain-containing protein [Chloroflexota bacterium]MBV9896752.1 glycoside hydrolase family 99-like domain-containing protein [Chloroflexota bacterium]
MAKPVHGEGIAGPTRARIIAFYLPQFHPIPENDTWWGKGFTEWTNVSRAKPLYPGHVQPKLPSELGFYDLRVPETRAQQAALAREYGVTGFCYWHYWFEGRRLLERPFMEVLASGEPDFPFCLGWANQSWTGIWHGAPNRVLIEQTYGDRDEMRRHFDSVLPAFIDPRYMRVDGRPIFVLHQPHEMADSRTFTDLWREWARSEGLPGIYFLGTHDVDWPARDYGFDGTILSNPWRVLRYRSRPRFDDVVARVLKGRDTTWASRRFLGWPMRIPYQDVLDHAIPPEIGETVYPNVLPNWDNTPRSGRNGLVITGSSPELFHEHLSRAISLVEKRPYQRRLVFLKSWNEWAEGNFVEPDVLHGRRYLEAVQQAQIAPARPMIATVGRAGDD